MSLSNNIQANARSLFEILQNKYIVDYFQREYKWEFKHIEQLLIDLEASFLSNFEIGQTTQDVSSYNTYYLGPVVICQKGSIRSIVDGQQRLTSVTLLLIYLNNLQKNSIDPEEISQLIFSKKGGRKTYNIEVPDRTNILEKLYNDEEFLISEEKDESVKNMFERYQDITNVFSEELKTKKLPLFIEWLKEKVIMVEILAFSDENAYTIFETMNDRGLNLTPTEMLKGYLLTHIKDSDKVDEINSIWKERISALHKYSTQEDLEFIRAWLRSQYAESIRSGLRGAENEDFEKIGTRFHTWVKDNHKKIGLINQNDFYNFIKGDFEFYSSLYEKIKFYESKISNDVESLYLGSYWSTASSLSYPLLMSSITKLDDEITINSKLEAISRFLDILVVSRALNGKGISQSFLRYIIYTLVKETRNKSIHELKEILKERITSSKDNFDDLDKINITSLHRKFVHYLLARINFHINGIYEKPVNLSDLLAPRRQNRYVTHNLIDNYSIEENDFSNEDYFNFYKNKLGNVILIPNPIHNEINGKIENRKFNKLKNDLLLNQSILNTFYTNNLDNYLVNLGVQPLNDIKEFIDNRTQVMSNIIREIWDVNKI